MSDESKQSNVVSLRGASIEAPPEPGKPIESVINAIDMARERAAAADVVSVVVCAILRDGSVMRTWSVAADQHFQVLGGLYDVLSEMQKIGGGP